MRPPRAMHLLRPRVQMRAVRAISASSDAGHGVRKPGVRKPNPCRQACPREECCLLSEHCGHRELAVRRLWLRTSAPSYGAHGSSTRTSHTRRAQAQGARAFVIRRHAPWKLDICCSSASFSCLKRASCDASSSRSEAISLRCSVSCAMCSLERAVETRSPLMAVRRSMLESS